jgi:hypothetical protein
VQKKIIEKLVRQAIYARCKQSYPHHAMKDELIRRKIG